MFFKPLCQNPLRASSYGNQLENIHSWRLTPNQKKPANNFHIDNKFDDMNPEERKIMRQKDLTPALFDFFAWVKSEYELALPKSKYGQAVEYAMNQGQKVLRVLDDGRLELDDNLAKQTVKPFVIGRKYRIMCSW